MGQVPSSPSPSSMDAPAGKTFTSWSHFTLMTPSAVGKVRSISPTFQRRKLRFRDEVRVKQPAKGGARTGLDPITQALGSLHSTRGPPPVPGRLPASLPSPPQLTGPASSPTEPGGPAHSCPR